MAQLQDLLNKEVVNKLYDIHETKYTLGDNEEDYQVPKGYDELDINIPEQNDNYGN